MNQLNDFRTRLLEEEKSPLTVEKYLRDIRRFLDWLGPRPLSREQTLAWKQQLAASYAPASANSMLSALNRWLGHIGRADCRVRFLRRRFCARCGRNQRKGYRYKNNSRCGRNIS